VKQADVCIATRGLFGSNGYKLGEYLAASRAVISERMTYMVPGDFAEQQNYIAFDHPKQCAQHAEELISDRARIYAMQAHNYKYSRVRSARSHGAEYADNRTTAKHVLLLEFYLLQHLGFCSPQRARICSWPGTKMSLGGSISTAAQSRCRGAVEPLVYRRSSDYYRTRNHGQHSWRVDRREPARRPVGRAMAS
jgi:hypothetical protein